MERTEDWQTASEAVLLASMPEDLAENILTQSEIRSFERGTSIFHQGDSAECLYIVLEGRIKLYRLSQNGAEAVVEVITKGRGFAEAPAFQEGEYPVSAEAVTNSRVLQISASLILGMMRERPELCMAILATTFRHLHALTAQIEQLKVQTGTQRVAAFLLNLCSVDQGACTVTLPYDKVLIAGRLGLTPESLSRAFARLRQVGVAIKDSQAAISEVQHLRAYIEEDGATAGRRPQQQSNAAT